MPNEESNKWLVVLYNPTNNWRDIIDSANNNTLIPITYNNERNVECTGYARVIACEYSVQKSQENYKPISVNVIITFDYPVYRSQVAKFYILTATVSYIDTYKL